MYLHSLTVILYLFTCNLYACYSPKYGFGCANFKQNQNLHNRFLLYFEKDDYNYLPQNTNDFKAVGM